VKRARWITWIVVLAFILSACTLPHVPITTTQPNVETNPTPTPEATTTPNLSTSSNTPVSPSGDLALGLQSRLEQVYEKVNPSVVHIRVTKVEPTGALFGEEPLVHGSGSGFVWDEAGHIVTNNHVVEGATRVRVIFYDGTEVPGNVVGTDPDSDLAVIQVKVKRSLLHPVTLTDSTKVKVGQIAIAIGNPFGLQGTMTVGVVSALGRTLPAEHESALGGHYLIPDIIQTDAAINPGNSGGVLVDIEGRVMGVTSAIVSPIRASAGIGFAIPSIIVKKVVPQLIEKGYAEHPWIGIKGTTLQPVIAKAMGLDEQQRGALVVQVIPDSPADKAGLRGCDRRARVEVDGEEVEVPIGGDIIVAVDKHPIRSFDDLVTYLARYTQVGQTITLTVLRDGKEVDVPLTLAARARAHQESPTTHRPHQAGQAWLGIWGISMSPEIARAMGLPEEQKGVLVEQVFANSPADKAGLRGGYKPILINGQQVLVGGDVIIALDDQQVDTMKTLQNLLAQHAPGDTVTLTVLRDGETVKIEVTLGTRPKQLHP